MGCGTSRNVLGEQTWAADSSALAYPDIIVMRGMPLPLTWFNGGYEKLPEQICGKPVYRRDGEIATRFCDNPSLAPSASGMIAVTIFWAESLHKWVCCRDGDTRPAAGHTGKTMQKSMNPTPTPVGNWTGGCAVGAIKQAPTNLSYDPTSRDNASSPQVTRRPRTPVDAGMPIKISPVAEFKPGYPGPIFSAKDLPEGLFLDQTTGVVTGMLTSAGEYSVTLRATNNKGQCSFQLELSVVHKPPGAVKYEGLSCAKTGTVHSIFVANKKMTPALPTCTGANLTFTVDPELPAGLSLDSRSGEISGRPTTVTPKTNFCVLATNIAGATSVTISLSVALKWMEMASPLDFSADQVQLWLQDVEGVGSKDREEFVGVTGHVLFSEPYVATVIKSRSALRSDFNLSKPALEALVVGINEFQTAAPPEASAAAVEEDPVAAARKRDHADLFLKLSAAAAESGLDVKEAIHCEEVQHQSKFDQPRMLVYGLAEHSTLGLAGYMCCSSAHLHAQLALGVQAIVDEVKDRSTLDQVHRRLATLEAEVQEAMTARDMSRVVTKGKQVEEMSKAAKELEVEMDSTQDCLEYLLYAQAGSSHKLFQNNWKMDCDPESKTVLASRLVDDGDGGQRGMMLRDFHAHPTSVMCNLSLEEVLAARLYTTKAFMRINKPLRDVTRKENSEPVLSLRKQCVCMQKSFVFLM